MSGNPLRTSRVKYPRTYHLPWSPGVTSDDRVLPDASVFQDQDVVVTLKMDGENTTLYRDYMHARSVEFEPHPSRDRAKAAWGAVAHDIPDGWRVCAENVYAKHSIKYSDLPGYLLVFSVWNDRNECLPWPETTEWAALLGLPVVPEIYCGEYDRERIEARYKLASAKAEHEGYVVRLARGFPYCDFRRSVAKYVRASHVQTHGHWIRQRVEPNELRER